jgi:hypothetical protein
MHSTIGLIFVNLAYITVSILFASFYGFSFRQINFVNLSQTGPNIFKNLVSFYLNLFTVRVWSWSVWNAPHLITSAKQRVSFINGR